jgi:hypothetical protein
MAEPPRPPRPRSGSTGTGFRPEFTLYLFYFFAFFVFFALLLALPDLLEGMRTLPQAATIEEERAAGAQIARRALAGRLPLAVVAALVALGVGGYVGALPGLRGGRRR